jgi:hypothetical protein
MVCLLLGASLLVFVFDMCLLACVSDYFCVCQMSAFVSAFLSVCQGWAFALWVFEQIAHFFQKQAMQSFALFLEPIAPCRSFCKEPGSKLLSIARVGHSVLLRSERPVLFRSFLERNVLFRSFFEFLATYETQKSNEIAAFI